MDTSRTTIGGGPSRSLGVLLVVLLLLLPACEDDPILGPTEGDSTSTGGSYSNLERLAPTDSAAKADSSLLAPTAPNPERF